MKKSFVGIFVMALMVVSSTLTAQEAEVTLEAQAVETVTAVVEADAPAEAVAPTAVDAQESVSDGVVSEEVAVPLPVADAPVASGVIYDAGIVTEGVAVGGGCCGQPVQACGSCCGQVSPVQPVVFNQPIFQEAQPVVVSGCSSCSGSVVSAVQPVVFNQPIFAQSSSSQPIPASTDSIVNPAPAPAAFSAEPVTSGCSSCNGGAVVNYAPAPVATSFETPVVSDSFVSAPVESVGCSSCGVQVAPACDSCQNSRRIFNRRGIFTRLRNSAITSAIDDN